MAWSKKTRVTLMIIINTLFLALELGIGIAVGSLALMADAFHMLNDIISLAVGLWAVLVAQESSSDKYSFGYIRAEILGAFFNAVFLIALCFSIILEATQRFFDIREIKNPIFILIVGCFGLASNVGGFLILGGHSHGHSHSHGPEEYINSHNENTQIDEENHNENYEHNYHRDPTKCKAKFGQRLHFSPVDSESIDSRPLPCANAPRKKSSSKSCRLNQDDIDIYPASYRQNIIAACTPQLSENYDILSETSMGEENFNAIQNEASESDPLIAKKKCYKNDLCNSWHNGHNHNKRKKSKGNDHFHADMGMNAIILHVIGDALGNVGVIISALIIWLTNWSGRFYADPAVSILITLIIMRSTIPLTIATAKILLQATPDHIEVHDIKNDIEALPGVANCHHVHIWQLSDIQLIASMHIHFEFSMSEATEEKYMSTARAVRQCLHAYGIHSATIQPEFCEYKDSTHDSNLRTDSTLDDVAGQSRCGQGVDKCLLECVDNCQGKPCCNPKTRELQCNDQEL